MKAPEKPKKPSKNQNPPKKTRWVEYNIYQSYSGKDFQIRVGGLTEKELDDCDLYRLEKITKKLISMIQDKFVDSIDYEIVCENHFHCNDYFLRVLEHVPEEEYILLLKEFENRFLQYEEDLKTYESEKLKYEEYKKVKKIERLKEQIEELEKS